MTLTPTALEQEKRDAAIAAILAATATNTMIKLPPFDPEKSVQSPTVASATVGMEQNVFGSTYGEFRWQFEGEEDLLHLIVTRSNFQTLTVEEAQTVVAFILRGIPQALIWLKPGEYSQHFYVGHDEVERYVER